MGNKKLYKDPTDKKISGVCSGIAKYFEIDATIVRLLWAIAVFVFGTGALAYIICAIIMSDPPEGYTEVDYTEVNNE